LGVKKLNLIFKFGSFHAHKALTNRNYSRTPTSQCRHPCRT
jgi:hypothetical protein